MTRGTDWTRARKLRDALWADATDDVPGRELTDAVLARFSSDRREYSDILEWSLCEDTNGIDLARFSYAFPGYGRTPREITHAVVSWSEGVGAAAGRAARSVMRAARHAAVEQVLVGYAHGAGAPSRAKLYLQFRSTAGKAALQLAHAVLGTNRPTQSDRLPLHLMGLDVGAGGLAGAKLYFVERERGPRFGAWPTPLENTLRIHRLRGPDDPGFETPSEIDFSLPENDLTWTELANTPLLAPFALARRRLEELGAAFRLRVRRVSLSLGGSPKLNVYYVLDEVEGNPPGGG